VADALSALHRLSRVDTSAIRDDLRAVKQGASPAKQRFGIVAEIAREGIVQAEEAERDRCRGGRRDFDAD